MFIIRNIPEQKYFVDIKHVTVTPESVTELAHSMLKSFTPQTGITIEVAPHVNPPLAKITSCSVADLNGRC